MRAEEFRSEFGSRLNGTLPLRVALGRAKDAAITVHKQGVGAKALTAKARRIAAFVASRIDLEYIPAVRTAASAKGVVEELVSRELATLEDTEEYRTAINTIAELQAPVLRALSESIRRTLVKFLPDIKTVDVRAPADRRYEALRRCEIQIDDGCMTDLRLKGDGVQSLAALGLMRHASESSSLGKNLIIAIEEPESHLHPRAIHELRSVVERMAEKNQVVVTTHCPLFVNRGHMPSNIIVSNSRAKPANSVEEVREILGVRASDNLRHAELVLVVEGTTDRTSISALLREHSELLAGALQTNQLAIDTLGGASNLKYKLGLLRDALCDYHCLLDDDRSGHESFACAKKEGLIDDTGVHFTTCVGMKEAEFEDFLDANMVNDILKTTYNIQNQKTPKTFRAKKWSSRMSAVFASNGRRWDESTESALKATVATAVEESAVSALNSHHASAFRALVSHLEGLLQPKATE